MGIRYVDAVSQKDTFIYGSPRVFALFRHNKPIGLFLAAYLLTEFTVKLWITFSPGSHGKVFRLELIFETQTIIASKPYRYLRTSDILMRSSVCVFNFYLHHLRLTSGVTVCISIGPDAAGMYAPSPSRTRLANWSVLHRGFAKSALFQFMQTAYDTIVFVLVLYGTSRIARDSQQSIISRSRKHDLINVIAAQGIMYYA